MKTVPPPSMQQTTMAPLDAHIGVLSHLTTENVARRTLRDRFQRTHKELVSDTAELASHVAQGLRFLEQARKAPTEIRPVLQYYAYLNLACAVIVAYRPSGFEQLRQHGVEDTSKKLPRLTWGSKVLKITRGAVPLFHSIVSDAPLSGPKTFREIVCGVGMVQMELSALNAPVEKKKDRAIYVEGEIVHGHADPTGI